MPETALAQLREAIEDGTHVFSPPFMGQAVLELAARVEALESVLVALGWAELDELNEALAELERRGLIEKVT
jgi:hypothetical protein